MVDCSRTSANLHKLAAQVLARYGSIDAFCAHLYLMLDYPTTELPATGHPRPGGESASTDPAEGLGSTRRCR
ncbi:hypothetical protein ACWIGI_37655 [Nocardia sp. NPDC055321]